MLEESSKTLYKLIGEEFIAHAIAEFYRRAFSDPMIGHFFFDSSLEKITLAQTEFATALLGGPKNYRGQPLKLAHKPFFIRPPHFARRQVLMREVLTDLGLSSELIHKWLELEEQFRPVVLTQPESCRS